MASIIQRKVQPPCLVDESPEYPQQPGRACRWKVFNQQALAYGLLFIGKAFRPINLLPVPRKVAEFVPHIVVCWDALSSHPSVFPVRVRSSTLSGRTELFSVSNELFLSWLSSAQHHVRERSYNKIQQKKNPSALVHVNIQHAAI